MIWKVSYFLSPTGSSAYTENKVMLCRVKGIFLTHSARGYSEGKAHINSHLSPLSIHMKPKTSRLLMTNRKWIQNDSITGALESTEWRYETIAFPVTLLFRHS